MDFSYDDEQQALRDAVRGLVGKAYADHENRRQAVAADPGFDEKLWARMAEMGILGLPFSEDDGGVGAGPVEIGIVCQELGRVVAPEPYLVSVVLAGGLVSAAGTAEQRREVLGPLTEGERVLSFAHLEPAAEGGLPSTSPERVTSARHDDDGWVLDGVKEPVPHGARADLLVVSAALPDGGGTGLFLVPGDASGLTRTGYPTYDGGRAALVRFEATPAEPLGEPGADLTSTIDTVLDIARIMAGQEALGGMQTLLRTTTEYLKSRKQFGVTLNTFQALNFRAADMYVSLELTHSLVEWATMVLAAGDPEAVADAAARVALQVSRAGRHISQESIQLHGGIAMTAEYSVGNMAAHLSALEVLLGGGTEPLATLSAGLDDHEELDPLE